MRPLSDSRLYFRSAPYTLLLLLCQALLCRAVLQKYSWNITYVTIAPDCVTKTMPVINGQYPGPELSGVQGDSFAIQVCNGLGDQNVTMHWHGLLQRTTQWADGPAYGTQCPILPGDCFTYRFSTANQAGTYWYHGHINLLRNSVYGALIIRYPEWIKEPFPKPRAEKTLLFNDWYHRSSLDILAGLHSKNWQFIGEPDAILINGRGQTDCASYQCPVETFSPSPKCGVCDNKSPFCNPLTTFIVTPGGTYRFRFVNVALWTQINIQIEGHNFTLVEIDGHFVKPLTVPSLQTAPGQAFSVLVKFNKEPRAYWLAANGQYDNLGSNPGKAVIHYRGSCGRAGCANPVPKTPLPTGPDYTDVSFGPLQQLKFKSLSDVPALATQKIDRYLVFQLNMNQNDGYIRYSVNNQTFERMETPLLASEYYGFPGVFTKDNELPSFPPPLNTSFLGLPPAKQTASVVTIEKNHWVQIVIQNHNPPGGHHPWHLHGYDFYVVGYGRGEYDYRKEKQYEKKYNLKDPHIRNVITVWENYWIAIRFKAHNEGLWNMHCHMEPHVELGMQVFLRVRNSTGNSTIRPPPLDYPKCGKLATWKPACRSCKWTPGNP